ncbi:unnamed protein product [Nippostrongylus brasiliensis]|uniref:Putative cytosolic purine 5-nucleotidase (inferred by orthology to a S. mansoni protein) n=1 Tax=Nippostrongylus brasiliensis TaxID=27835 RepID=A0A0N4YS16_NIPBR|nr:unnamed protein product [Nippostrongylus brasiliensis]
MDTMIYVNRSLRLDKIKAIGFDMDATLAVYKSPISEQLAFDLSVKRLLDLGYPKELEGMKYRDGFVARNAWKQIREKYRNKHVNLEESRIFVLNTVFNVPEAYLLAAVVDCFEKNKDEYEKLPKDHRLDSYGGAGDYKKTICSDLAAYIARDDRAVRTMTMLSRREKRLFLLTNSPWYFTNILMSYVMGPKWQDLFDVVIVEGNKPKWFLQDTPFKEIDTSTGHRKIGTHIGPLLKGDVYSGGCAADFIQRMNLTGKDILYVGDHIFGDIWTSQYAKFNQLLTLNQSLSYSESASGTVKKETLKEISKLTDVMEAEYAAMGSMLRCGWRQTHFASQLKKYADTYTYNVYNLSEYSPSFYFNSPIPLLPHEDKFMKALSRLSNEKSEDEKDKEKDKKSGQEDKEKERNNEQENTEKDNNNGQDGEDEEGKSPC